jgi:hypothetical protein
MAVCFVLRFRWGKWKTMRVIEAAPPAESPSAVLRAAEAVD